MVIKNGNTLKFLAQSLAIIRCLSAPLILSLFSFNSLATALTCEEALGKFEILAANSNFADSKILGFGDVHDSNDSILRTIGTIAAGLAQPGDVILLEGLESGKVVKQLEYFPTSMIPVPVEVIGMDKLDALDRSLELIKEAVQLEETCSANCAPRIKEIERELFEKTKQRIMEMGRLLDSLNRRAEVKRIWIIAGVGHLHPDQSPLSFALEKWRTPYMIFGPKGVSTEATLDQLKSHLARQEVLKKGPKGK